MTTLLLVDDHKLLRQGIRRAMEEAGFTVLGEAGDGEEAVRMAESLHPEVVLMDVSMPILDGIEATRLVRQQAPDSRVVILTMHGEEETVARAVRSGAVGFLVKDCSMEEVAETVRLAAGGDTALSSELAGTMLDELRQPRKAGPLDSVLSPREEEVLQLFANGCSTTEVAKQLYISAKTVKNHLGSIYQKLDARDRTQAVLRGVRMGIIQID